MSSEEPDEGSIVGNEPGTHPHIACPECDDVQNDACEFCAGTDSYCPVCECPADDCEWQEGWDDYESRNQ